MNAKFAKELAEERKKATLGAESVWLWHAHLARDARAGRPGHFFKLTDHLTLCCLCESLRALCV